MASEEKVQLTQSQGMQDSWVTLEEQGLTHVSSTEEMTELLAEAVNEGGRTLIEQQQHIETAGTISVIDTEGEQIHVILEDGDQANSDCETETNSVKRFLWQLVTPPFILSHLTVFLIGILVGRRLMAV